MDSISLLWNKTKIYIRNYNDDFLLLHSENELSLQYLGKALFQRQFDFVDELICTEHELCIKLNQRFEPSKLKAFEQLDAQDDINPTLHYLPVRFYEHEDWFTIEQQTGIKKDVFIDRLLEIEFSVALFGFLPGFVYFNGLPTEMHVPRKKIPTKYVKANALAIGGKYLGIYPFDSPGGWHIIGQTTKPLLNLSKLPPLPYQLQDRVKLILAT